MEDIIEKTYLEAVSALNENSLKNHQVWYDIVLNMPLKHKVTYTVVLFHSQVINGGFHQYFFNSYGQFAFLTQKHLELINARNSSLLLQKALDKILPKDITENEFRKLVFYRELKSISEFGDENFDYLNHLDDEYYENSEQVIQLLEDYLVANS